MGKTPKPLTIRVHSTFYEWPEIQALADQGHVISMDDSMDTVDLILSPQAWLMDEQHRKYLPLAIAEARRRQYPKETKNE